MSTVTNLVAAIFHLVSRFRAHLALLSALISHICLLSSRFLPFLDPQISDFAVTNFVSVLIFATFCTAPINRPPLKTNIYAGLSPKHARSVFSSASCFFRRASTRFWYRLPMRWYMRHASASIASMSQSISLLTVATSIPIVIKPVLRFSSWIRPLREEWPSSPLYSRSNRAAS